MHRISAVSIVLLAALLVAMMPGAAEAAPVPPGFSSTLAGTPLAARTDGAYLAWSEQVQPNRFVRYANLYVADMATGRVQLQLAQLSIFDYAGPFGAGFALGGGIVVWQDGAAGAGSNPLVARDLRTGTSWVVSENGGVFPGIAGDTIAWWELSSTGSAPVTALLKTRRLAPDAAPPAELLRLSLAHDYDLRAARVSGGWVAWVQAGGQAGAQPCPLLSLLPLSGGAPLPVADTACYDEQRIPFDLSGDRLAYVDRNNLLVERAPPAVELRRSGPHANLDLALADRYIFWNHAVEPGPWGFDPDTGSTFQLGSSDWKGDMAAGGGALAWFERGQAGGYVVRAQPITSLLPAAPRSPANPAGAGRAFFPETGHTLGGEFGVFWGRNGGLAVFGFPLTEELRQRSADTGMNYLVQYLERQRFEYHPENAGTPYAVLLGRLGAEALAAQNRDWQALPKASPSTPHYFAATGQAIAPEFWGYWRAHGLELGDSGVSEREALALWGYPLTAPAYEPLPTGETLLVQWFERARFEYHPGNPSPYQVLLGRLAADRVESFGWR